MNSSRRKSLSHSRSSSRSRSSSSSSSSSNKSKTSLYSESFSSTASSSTKEPTKRSENVEELKLKKLTASNSSLSSNQDSLVSGHTSNLSRAQSLRYLEEEYEPPTVDTNLPYNIYQTLFSIKTSMVNVYNLRNKHRVNNYL